MSRVVVAKYSANAAGKFLDKDQYRALLEPALSILAGEGNSDTYIRKRFPGGTVGMKANCLAAYNPTMLPLVDALSEILKEKAGYNDNDLILWDRTSRELERAGFKLNASAFGRRCLGTDANGIGYDDSQFHSSGSVNSLVTNILTTMVDQSINLGVLKHHSIAGISAGMKNMYGAVNNPNKYHGNNCSPYAADVNNLEPIRKKHRLTIVDAVRVQYDKGPGFSPGALDFYNGLVLSEDPVAADSVSLSIIEYLRKKNGVLPLAETGRGVKYLAAAEKIGLGIASTDKIDLQILVVDAAGKVTKGELF